VPIQIPVAGCTLGIGEFEKDVFTLSPNPASEQVTLTYSGLENENIMEIYDLVGRSLTQQNIKNETGSIIIPLNNYPSGIYVVVVRSEKGIVTQKKLIVE
ncbi:T9SS type A sorting domain-containing protein, partial [Flavobacterium sp.]